MLIILDRDGVINEDSDEYIKSPNEWHAIKGSLKAIAKLNKAEFKVVVVTNQSGVGRGLFSAQTLAEIHAKMLNKLEKVGGRLNGIYVCPHSPDENCNCRKPNIGLLEEVKAQYSNNFQQAIFIGDTIKEVQAAEKIGCRAILVRTGKGERTLQNHPELKKTIPIYADLKDAVSAILNKSIPTNK
jgi:D-glycero-D-manno-heptose 1,7-bisphosphate phosphatase